jgi:calcium/calmodulin-dependent protein kinase (CaM kinase) II
MSVDVDRLAEIAGLNAEQKEVLQLTHILLKAIHEGDLDTYRALCLPDLSCYETDVAPYRIDVIDFHIDLMRSQSAIGGFSNLTRFDILTPRVQLHGDSAIVTYTRLMTYAAAVPPAWKAFNETRVFVRLNGAWRLAHFHRSEAPT